MASSIPMVGLYNQPFRSCSTRSAQVDYVEVVPDRLWYDFGVGSHERFSRASAAIDELKRYAADPAVIGHGIGLSLPSAMPLDTQLLDEVADSHRDLSYQWYSEHLSMFLVPNRSVPNAQAGLGLPVALDDEMVELVGAKVRQLGQALGTRILLENPTIFSAIPEPDMTEPEFFNRLHETTGCGMLLDLHNLYANTVNLGISADEYLAALDPAIVGEIHLAGGDVLKGFHTDSHSRPTPAKVWQWAHEWAPRFPNLAQSRMSITSRLTARLAGIARELELMQARPVTDARQAQVRC